jgi:hypothetical protein
MSTTEIAKLKKRGSKDLEKKLSSGKCTVDEANAIVDILKGRGISVTSAEPKAEVEEKPIFFKPSKKEKPAAAAKRSKNPDVTSTAIAVGEVVELEIAKDTTISARIVKIYLDNRTKKNYVRLKELTGGKIYHKLLSHFEK